MFSIFFLAARFCFCYKPRVFKNIFKNKLIPRRMIFPEEKKLPTPLRTQRFDVDSCKQPCLCSTPAPAACYKMASKLRWTCVYYSLENESKSDERKWTTYEITERILLTLIWVKKILQAPELLLFLSLNRIECLPHTNTNTKRMFMSPYLKSMK